MTPMGLFVEHQQLYPIIYEGNNGTIIMTQGETSYHDNNPSWSSGDIISGYRPGIYFTIGSQVSKIYYNGGGIYAIATPTGQDDKAPYPLGIYSINMSDYTITNLVIGAWSDGGPGENPRFLNSVYSSGYSGSGPIVNSKRRFCNVRQNLGN